MATSIVDAPLVVKITENITLNGKQHGGTITKTISGINEITKRIVSVTTDESTLLEFADAGASGDNVLKYDLQLVKYVRITNLESTEITLGIKGAGNLVSSHILPGGASWILFDLENSFNVNASDTATPTADQDIVEIRADSSSGTVDLEVMVAS
tara:strand:+ start:3039 stop:3503 length:465 start_codon:yes stop_codon:yes gene_type:complete